MAESDELDISVRRLEELRVLAVDVCELLRLLGIGARRAENAAVALDMLEAGDIDVLLTDVVMSDMSGLELARRATAIHQELQVIFASGNTVPEQETLEFGWSTLRKPYSLAQLQDTLQSASNRQAKRKVGRAITTRVRDSSDKPGSGP